ncbi:hypothetical protein MAPG_10998 [Magnaporthiopsis poae ATCC 64411]|uniref:Uncharacterized protein n=1 Tax=Magnaporthiopsis poae (strain ATCC 64411 / 73-15) TaxID=644358 RepID=A0A0C4EE33_MAGP6|nr:hypothetical protein MAPG_10998 [Magnaporthiopsis poae ATCC 64411]
MPPRSGAAAMKSATRAFVKGTSSPSLNQRTEGGNMVGLFMLPGTLVPPPVLRSLRESFSEGLKFQWTRARLRMGDALRMVGCWYASKPSFLKPARLRINRASLVPTAKALHRTMSEALAAGDRDTLRRICVPSLFEDLSARLARRKRGRRYEWSLERYTNPLQFPRIVDHKLAALPGQGGQLTYMHQVVVAISSRQRLAQYDDTKRGMLVPGSEKTVDLVENLILVRPIDYKTYAPGEWTVFGHAEEGTLESFSAEQRALGMLAAQQPR